MIQFGRSIRWYNDYDEEVEFCRHHGFDFLQIWYIKGDLALDQVSAPKAQKVKEAGFPTIIHAVLDIHEFEEHVPKIIDILNYLEYKELIIHPVYESETITAQSIYKLSEKVGKACELLKAQGIKLYIENNSRLDPINYTAEELAILFGQNKEAELLLDVAHIDSYEHLEEILKIRKPHLLHVADKHFDVIHEHLPLGQGDMDYGLIFDSYLKDFEGRIIFEVVAEDDEIIRSKKALQSILYDEVNR